MQMTPLLLSKELEMREIFAAEILTCKIGFFITIACTSDHTNLNKQLRYNAQFYAVLPRQLVP